MEEPQTLSHHEEENFMLMRNTHQFARECEIGFCSGVSVCFSSSCYPDFCILFSPSILKFFSLIKAGSLHALI